MPARRKAADPHDAQPDTASGTASGTNDSPQSVLYRERLLPKPFIWPLLAAAPGALGIAYGAAFSATVGWLIFLVGLAVLVVLIVLGSPVILVTDREIVAGRARLPRSLVTGVTTLDASTGTLREQLRNAATAFTLVRAWAGATGIRIDLVDPEDPHPCWLLSSRRPLVLAETLQAQDLQQRSLVQ